MTPPTMLTARLVLRPFTNDDLDPLVTLLHGSDVLRYFPDTTPPTYAQVQRMLNRIQQHWADHGFGLWAVTSAATRALIGRCGIAVIPDTGEVEFDVLFGADFWGQGFATEAGQACLRYAVAHIHAHEIVGIVHPDNLASQRVLEKLGLIRGIRTNYFGMECFRYAIPWARAEELYR